MKYAISACLMGVNCKYNGGNNFHPLLAEYMKDQDYILVCPEVSSGLPTPRIPSECRLDKVINKEGKDVTFYFEKGAQIELEHMIKSGCECFICQSRSPSCGKDYIYDGTFSKKLISGNGVLVQKCIQKGIKVMDIQAFSAEISKKVKKSDDNSKKGL